MPVTKIKVYFKNLDVLDDSDWLWGAGEWTLHATVDGTAVGNSSREYSVRTGDALPLPEADWSTIVDVSGKGPGDKVVIRFKVIEKDVFSDDDLGEVTAEVAYPFRNPLLDLRLRSPLLDGGWFFDDYRCYVLNIQVTIAEEFASTATAGPTSIPVTRTVAGGATFTTIKGVAFTPRVDVCPVIPVPAPPGFLPRRPVLPAGLAVGAVTPAASIAAAPSAPTLNAMANPSLIPILDAANPNIANLCANLAVTFYEPGNIETDKLVWKVASGPAVIIGSNRGLTIQARGTPVGADTLAVFEIHWDSDAGPLLATYRAWVGKVGTLPYRVTVLNGSTAALNVGAIVPSATIQSIMQVTQAILYQAGIMLVPDTNVTGFEGATLFPAGNANAIFQTNVTNNAHTRLVNNNMVSRSTRYNFRPGVINFVYVHSTLDSPGVVTGPAAAVERNGIAGVPAPVSIIKGNRFYKGGASGSTKQLDGSPSSSWIDPSGVGLDPAGIKLTLVTIDPTDRVKQAAPMDKSFVTARNTSAPPFTGAMMGQLYAAHVPALWGQAQVTAGTWTAAQFIWKSGINIAHELGHILGLAHRGAGWSATAPLSADFMDCKNQLGVMKGHPWNENVMCYGYFALTPPLPHDIDLIQTSVVRTHPAITY
jgi:hypothetical protein